MLAAAALLAWGCAGVDPGPDYDLAARYVREATGRQHVWRPGDDDAAARRVAELLAGGISAGEAVKISLLNNPDLQAAFLSIGLARADVVQAGLLSNPSLSALLRFPPGGGVTNLEAGLAQNLIELWQLPVRVEVAKTRLERTVLRIAFQASTIAAEAKASYFAALASLRALAVEEENLSIIRELLDLTTARQRAGAATEVDVNVVRAQLLEQEITTRSARLRSHEARRELALLLGLGTPPDELELAGTLPEPADWALTLERVLEVAERYRLDLEVARAEVERARHAVELERRLFLRRAGAGVELEAEGSDVRLGPGLDLELPIFDQNQAQIAKAELRYQQALRGYIGARLAVVQNARGAYRRALTAWETARTYGRELLPLEERNLDLARESFRLGRTGFLAVLEVQQTFLAARRDYVSRLEALTRALAELEREAGRPLEEILSGRDGSELEPGAGEGSPAEPGAGEEAQETR